MHGGTWAKRITNACVECPAGQFAAGRRQLYKMLYRNTRILWLRRNASCARRGKARSRKEALVHVKSVHRGNTTALRVQSAFHVPRGSIRTNRDIFTASRARPCPFQTQARRSAPIAAPATKRLRTAPRARNAKGGSGGSTKRYRDA